MSKISNKNSKKLILLILILTTLIITTACIPGNGINTREDPAGFFRGIWHGWIAPFSLVLSIFNPSASIYEIHNTGFWYDLGFYAAIISGFGGFSISRNKNKRKDKR